MGDDLCSDHFRAQRLRAGSSRDTPELSEIINTLLDRLVYPRTAAHQINTRNVELPSRVVGDRTIMVSLSLSRYIHICVSTYLYVYVYTCTMCVCYIYIYVSLMYMRTYAYDMLVN